MKDIKEVFKNDFVLKITSNINSIDYVEGVTLQVFPSDYEEEEIPQHAFMKKQTPKKPNEPKKETKIYPEPKTRNGMMDIDGDWHGIGSGSYKVEIRKSVGGLVAVPIYVQYGDDIMGVYYPERRGFVVLDKDLNIVYKNAINASSVFYNQEDAYKFLHNFGPCALALMQPKGFNSDVQQDVQRVFEMRVKKQEENFINPAKIEEEKKQFKEAFQILKKEYENTRSNNFEL